MVTTDDRDLWSRMWSFKDHGKSWEAVYDREHPPGFRWVHESFGTNWRMLEVQAAIGRIQLRRMAEWTRRRSAIAERLASALGEYPRALRMPLPPAGFEHAFYRLYSYVRPEGLKPGWTRDRIIADLADQGIPAYQGSCSEVYLERAFDETPWRPERPLPVARELGETSLMFLAHPTLTEDEVDRICDAIRNTLDKAALVDATANAA
jgi:dTDP-4-amino-4,6-dideoxygalactose transaminase